LINRPLRRQHGRMCRQGKQNTLLLERVKETNIITAKLQ
jgi:hypothetical protein